MSVGKKNAANVPTKFALRLMPSVRIGAERISASEGVSLNQFINLAIAEKVARLEHAQWAASRKPITDEDRADALALVRRGGKLPPRKGDEMPVKSRTSKRRSSAGAVTPPGDRGLHSAQQ
jgi:hypothetical protein